MIELIAEGKYYIDLPNDIEISIVVENPLFLEDRIPAPYSLDFEVPATFGNLQAFGFPTRPTSKIVKRKLPALLKYFGLIFGYGELLLLESQKQLKLQFKGSLEHENVDKNINQLDLGEYNYGNVDNFYYGGWNGNNWRQIDYYSAAYSAYKNGMWNESRFGIDFVVAPIKIKGEDAWWGGLESYNGMVNTFTQYINFYNPKNAVFSLENDLNDFHTPILPCPYLWKVIENGFGGQLVNNPFASGDLRKLVLVAENHKNYSMDQLHLIWWQYLNDGTGTSAMHESFLPLIEAYGQYPEKLKVILKSFMQAYSFKSLLKSVLKIFCMTAFPGNKYRLEFNNDIFNRNVVKNLDKQLTDDLLISYEDGKDYVFSYSEYGESDVKTGGANANGWQNIIDIFNFAMTIIPINEPNNMKDRCSGGIFNITKELRGLSSEKRLKSEVTRSPYAISKVSHSRGLFSMTSDISPMNMNFHKFWWKNVNSGDIIPMKHWFVPELDKKEVDAPPHLMFFGGVADTLDTAYYTYPYLMAHHTDHMGIKRLNTSLRPEGNGGLLEKFHGQYKSWMEKDKIRAHGSFKITPLEIKNLDIRDKFYVRGKLFYIEKLEYSITHRNISLVDMDLVGV
ncbi:MAG: hypothetical protein NTZ33_06410 [Bacteroidetes bacterium]|nr:hypothetical protein [Bacteroidota bacterium]